MAQTHERESAVCTNDFTTPKILLCGHLLCRECVISWMDSKPGGGCPLCRCPIVEQSDQSSSDTVDALPTDFVMEALVESARVLSKHHVCCVCDDVKADFICMQCQDMLCSACTKAHKKLSATRSHDVESLSTVIPERKSNKHKVCAKASFLVDEIELAENSLKDLTKILVEAEQKLEQAIGQLTSRLQEVDVGEQEDMAQVDKTCDRLQKLVKDFREKLKKKTRTSYLKIRNYLHDLKTDLSNRLGKVTSHKHIVTRATAVSPRPALIHMRQTLTDRVNSLDLSADLQGGVWVKRLLSADYGEEVVETIEKDLMMIEQQKTETKFYLLPPVLVFHENCGTNIRLTNCNTTAERIDPEKLGNGVVVSRDAMATNVLYEVRVDTVTDTDSRLVLGLTVIPPTRLVVTKLSTHLEDTVIIMPHLIWYKGKYVNTSLGDGLKRLQVRSRVGLLVDSSQHLHLYVDGQDQGVAPEHVTQPCFAVFDLGHAVIRVTALPTSKRT